jgi:NADPH:quinone reductase-like Zn-dependent oxidoreductase
MTPGHDVVGRIVAVGLDVKDFKEGDRVAALIRTGGNARFASVPEASLVRVPHSVNSAEACCMVSVYSAAYQSLKMVVSEGPMFSLRGKKVLVIGGMSDIGQAVVQMCNKARADVYATAPSRRHAYVIGTLGALPLPEDSQDWLPRVEGEMDVVFDGQCADGLEAAKKAVKKGGNVIWFGYSSMIKEEMGLFGPPIKAHLNRLFSVKCVDIWDHFQTDPESYKVRYTVRDKELSLQSSNTPHYVALVCRNTWSRSSSFSSGTSSVPTSPRGSP